ncbi:hypothetical protein GEMRC1_004926 [Eukaryota sp. GEM-RC1]
MLPFVKVSSLPLLSNLSDKTSPQSPLAINSSKRSRAYSIAINNQQKSKLMMNANQSESVLVACHVFELHLLSVLMMNVQSSTITHSILDNCRAFFWNSFLLDFKRFKILHHQSKMVGAFDLAFYYFLKNSDHDVRSIVNEFKSLVKICFSGSIRRNIYKYFLNYLNSAPSSEIDDLEQFIQTSPSPEILKFIEFCLDSLSSDSLPFSLDFLIFMENLFLEEQKSISVSLDAISLSFANSSRPISNFFKFCTPSNSFNSSFQSLSLTESNWTDDLCAFSCGHLMSGVDVSQEYQQLLITEVDSHLIDEFISRFSFKTGVLTTCCPRCWLS